MKVIGINMKVIGINMKVIGINTFLFESPFTGKSIDWFKKFAG